MDSNVIFKIIPLRFELNQNKERMTVREFVDYIEEKRRVSRFLVEDLRKKSPDKRAIYLKRLDLSLLFIRVENGRAFYDESELDELQ